MQPERTAGCDQPAEPDRRRCQGQAAPGKLGAQRQGGERNRRSVGWRSFGIHEGTVPADDGCRGQDQAGRCDYGVSAAAARQEKRGSCREEEGRGVKNRDSGWGRGVFPPRPPPPVCGRSGPPPARGHKKGGADGAEKGGGEEKKGGGGGGPPPPPPRAPGAGWGGKAPCP